MQEQAKELRAVEVGELGERLSALRLCEASGVEEVRRSLAQHGQLSARGELGGREAAAARAA
jgi:hypothetical protein